MDGEAGWWRTSGGWGRRLGRAVEELAGVRGDAVEREREVGGGRTKAGGERRVGVGSGQSSPVLKPARGWQAFGRRRGKRRKMGREMWDGGEWIRWKGLLSNAYWERGLTVLAPLRLSLFATATFMYYVPSI